MPDRFAALNGAQPFDSPMGFGGMAKFDCNVARNQAANIGSEIVSFVQGA